ncbi:MAG: SIR2 family protein [Chitinophagales bacterium]|nr:SIR2 family protein [Chitinophagales bacterium]
MRSTTVKKIAAILRNLRDGNEKRSAILFLGAGASKSAGIPTAGELVKILETDSRYQTLVEDCSDKSYASYMRELNPGDRKEFLQQYVDTAKLNQTHLYAATLMKERLIDTVVTVNFDPLMLRALAMVNIFPSVYDMAVSREFILGGIDHPAVVFLHGQSHGFWQLNTDDEMRMALDNIRNLFMQITGGRSWIIVGYSGNDPVFSELAKIQKFEHGIYWICYKNDDPEKKVMEELLDKPNKSSWYLKGYNSDEFFRALKNEMKLQEPNIINKPFSHLSEAVLEIGDFEIEERKEKWTIQIQTWIRAAIEGFEEGKGFEKIEAAQKENIDIAKLTMQVKEISDKKNFEEIKNIESYVLHSGNDEAVTALAYAYNGWGIELYNQSLSTSSDEVVLSKSIEKYIHSITIKPTYESYYNWGLALYLLATRKNYDENILNDVLDKYQKATDINASKDDAFYNWGLALHQLSIKKNTNELLLLQAIEKYEFATRIKPGYDIFLEWGISLYELAHIKNRDSKILQEAIVKYEQAKQINPLVSQIYYSWALALSELASAPDKAVEKELLLRKAREKYIEAINLKPDYYDAINGLSMLLSMINKIFQPQDLKKLTLETIQILENTEKNKEGTMPYNLACAYSIDQNSERALEWLEKSLKLTDVSRKQIESEDDLKDLHKLPEFIKLLDRYRPD